MENYVPFKQNLNIKWSYFSPALKFFYNEEK